MRAECVNIGDEVTIDMSQAQGEAHPAWLHGFETTVTSFPEVAHGRFGNLSRKPGVYKNRSLPYVRSPFANTVRVPSKFLRLNDTHEYLRRCRAYFELEDSHSEDSWHDQDFIRELPDTPFWEGDRVCGRSTLGMPHHSTDIFTVTHIAHSDLNSTGQTVYEISDRLETRFNWSKYFFEDDMRLVERGNVWKFHHNEPLAFTNNWEEVNFFRQVCEQREVRNPATGLYSWTSEELMSGLRTGLIHIATTSNILTSVGNCTASARRFRNAEIGARVAKLFIELYETA